MPGDGVDQAGCAGQWNEDLLDAIAGQRFSDVRDLQIVLRVEEAITGAEYGARISGYVPGQADAGRDVVRDRRLRTWRIDFQLISRSEVDRKPRMNPPSVLREEVISFGDAYPVRITKALLIEGWKTEIVGLKRCDGRSEVRNEACLTELNERLPECCRGVGIAGERIRSMLPRARFRRS